jgi:hypothetical protein
MIKSHWKRFAAIEKTLLIFLIVNCLSLLINDHLLKSKILKTINDFISPLSIGLYFGFMICKKEYRNGLIKYDEYQRNVNSPENSTRR